VSTALPRSGHRHRARAFHGSGVTSQRGRRAVKQTGRVRARGLNRALNLSIPEARLFVDLHGSEIRVLRSEPAPAGQPSRCNKTRGWLPMINAEVAPIHPQRRCCQHHEGARKVRIASDDHDLHQANFHWMGGFSDRFLTLADCHEPRFQVNRPR